jgi:hypothetical protein
VIRRRFGPAAGAAGADPKVLAEIDAQSRAAVARSRPKRPALLLPRPGRPGVSFTQTPRFQHGYAPVGKASGDGANAWVAVCFLGRGCFFGLLGCLAAWLLGFFF